MNFEAAGARIFFIAACKLTHEGFHAGVGEFMGL